MSTRAEPEPSLHRGMVLLLVAAAIPRLLLAFFEHGTNHPDEIFQMLEPAHRVAFGFGLEYSENGLSSDT